MMETGYLTVDRIKQLCAVNNLQLEEVKPELAVALCEGWTESSWKLSDEGRLLFQGPAARLSDFLSGLLLRRPPGEAPRPRRPPQETEQVSSGRDLDWQVVAEAAREVLAQSQRALWLAPELVAEHLWCAEGVARAVGRIAQALRLRAGRDARLLWAIEDTEGLELIVAGLWLMIADQRADADDPRLARTRSLHQRLCEVLGQC